MSGNAAWNMQVRAPYCPYLSCVLITTLQCQLPPGATLLGTILSSDKTTISAMVGDRSAHPLLISLANIKMSYRSKGSHHAFMLLGLLPIPKFIEHDKKVRGVLENRLIHECLDHILLPLKIAAKVGIMMDDPRGFSRHAFTPLAGYIADTPEAALMAAVAPKASHLTMAIYKQFGDPFQHEPRTGSTTLAQLHAISSKVDPTHDIKAYIKAAKEFRLNGVHLPFWRDWPLADLPLIFPPEVLHHMHKLFWDHDMRWCINILGADEIDFRFSILHPHTGYRHFKEGVSKMKQVTGRQHRDIQRYIVAVIAGAAPPDFVIAIRALQDFRYLAQAPIIDDKHCAKMEAALQLFHSHKQAIIDAGARTGKKNRPITHWQIPKIEFLQSVVANIRANGVVMQWSADITEHAHIKVVKEPVRAGNNQNHEEQICRTLDRTDKCRNFDLATSIRGSEVSLGKRSAASLPDHQDDSLSEAEDEDDPQGHTDYVSMFRRRREGKNYFQEAKLLVQQKSPPPPFPLRTFSVASTAFHLSRDPAFKRMTPEDVSLTFSMPDLVPALSHFFLRLTQNRDSMFSIGGRRYGTAQVVLPFEKLEVWTGVRLQSRDYYNRNIILQPEKLNAAPPNKDWPAGRRDIAIVNVDPKFSWPDSGLAGAGSFTPVTSNSDSDR